MIAIAPPWDLGYEGWRWQENTLKLFIKGLNWTYLRASRSKWYFSPWHWSMSVIINQVMTNTHTALTIFLLAVLHGRNLKLRNDRIILLSWEGWLRIRATAVACAPYSLRRLSLPKEHTRDSTEVSINNYPFFWLSHLQEVRVSSFVPTVFP